MGDREELTGAEVSCVRGGRLRRQQVTHSGLDRAS